jgi:hypothetical protein
MLDGVEGDFVFGERASKSLWHVLLFAFLFFYSATLITHTLVFTVYAWR